MMSQSNEEILKEIKELHNDIKGYRDEIAFSSNALTKIGRKIIDTFCSNAISIVDFLNNTDMNKFGDFPVYEFNVLMESYETKNPIIVEPDGITVCYYTGNGSWDETYFYPYSLLLHPREKLEELEALHKAFLEDLDKEAHIQSDANYALFLELKKQYEPESITLTAYALEGYNSIEPPLRPLTLNGKLLQSKALLLSPQEQKERMKQISADTNETFKEALERLED